MNSNNSNNNKINKTEYKFLTFNERKKIVEGFIKIKKERENPDINDLDKKSLSIKDTSRTSSKNIDLLSDFDIIEEFDLSGIKSVESQEEENYECDLSVNFSKSDVDLSKEKINLWEIIPISRSIKKSSKNGLMKSLVSKIVYNGITFKDKLNESSSTKSIIVYDTIENNYSQKLLKKIQNSFIYMSYRTGLVNTSFLPGKKNDYTSDCGWGCMVRCSQMMLSRGLLKKKIYDFKQSNPNKEINIDELRKEIIILFYDKFIEVEKIWMNEEICDIYKKLLKDKVELVELIPPYSIYILTLLGKCPNVFTSDHKMISSFIKINTVLFNEYIKIIHFKDGIVHKDKLFSAFCQKIESQEEEKKENNEKYNLDKYNFVKGGLIFISLRLGLENIESCFIKMIPKLFINLHNNIGFVSGKKRRAFYFIGMCGDKLIFADPHLNQKIEVDEINFPTYLVNDLFLISPKELSSEITVGVSIFNKEELKQFLQDMENLQKVYPEFIKYQE